PLEVLENLHVDPVVIDLQLNALFLATPGELEPCLVLVVVDVAPHFVEHEVAARDQLSAPGDADILVRILDALRVEEPDRLAVRSHPAVRVKVVPLLADEREKFLKPTVLDFCAKVASPPTTKAGVRVVIENALHSETRRESNPHCCELIKHVLY